jgi:hypothetical protein
MFGIIFSDWRAEPDKTNMFLESSAPHIIRKKIKHIHILLFKKIKF